jgi:hypothetical protein
VWITEFDSSGVIAKPKSKLYSYEFDSAGRILSKTRWSGFLKDSVSVFTYDSSGRLRSQKITHSNNEIFYSWNYELNAKTGATVRTMKQGNETVEVAAIWTDSLNKLQCESIWNGRIMGGNPSYRLCFNSAGKLISESRSNIDYREYKYDDAGNLEQITWRSSWKQTSAPPTSVYYENTYREVHLVSIKGPQETRSFTYNSKGWIITQQSELTGNGGKKILEGMYTYF